MKGASGAFLSSQLDYGLDLRQCCSGIDGFYLLVKFRDLLLEFSDDQEAAICRPIGLTHGVALMSAKDQTVMSKLMLRCRGGGLKSAITQV